MRERIAVGLGLVLVVGAFVAVMSDAWPRRSGTNAQVRGSGNLVSIAPGKRFCQAEALVPKGTAVLRLFALRFRPRSEGGPVRITIERAGRVLATAHLPPGLSGVTSPRTPIARIRRDTSATVCFLNQGASTAQFAGNLTPVVGGNNPSGARLPDVVRIDYIRPGRETWWSLAPVVAERFGLAKASFVGSWTLYAVLGAFALLCAGGIALVLSRSRS